MGLGKGEQMQNLLKSRSRDGKSRTSLRFIKRMKNRRERRCARRDPECVPQYRKYCGWIY
jgi:hypothetical protein